MIGRDWGEDFPSANSGPHTKVPIRERGAGMRQAQLRLGMAGRVKSGPNANQPERAGGIRRRRSVKRGAGISPGGRGLMVRFDHLMGRMSPMRWKLRDGLANEALDEGWNGMRECEGKSRW